MHRLYVMRVQFWQAAKKTEYMSWCVQVIFFKYLQLSVLAIKQCITKHLM